MTESTHGPISYAPSDGLTYNPNNPKYWHAASLEKELVRTFDICNGCRMCFKFCPSFPTLFEAFDEHEHASDIPAAKREQVVDECFQCKLCYTECPYTDAEGHEYRIDFPRLLLRANAQRRRRNGIPLRERMLGNPDRLGKLASLAPGLVNAASALKLNRVMMEKTVGIHRDKLLPSFAKESFETWFLRENGGARETVGGERPVALFATCFVNWNEPGLGQAAVRVLRKQDCRVALPTVGCCGMPALDGGDVDFARQKARTAVDALFPLVEKGCAIAAINPTCSLMLKQETPELLDDPEDTATAERAKVVAAATRDICEYLFELRQAGVFSDDFKSTPGGNVAYHAPCHLRMQSIGFRGRDLMRRIPGVKPRLVTECCGHDGTWAMKKEYFDASMKYGKKAFDGMRAADAEVWTTDCPLAALQFEQSCGKRPLHPVQVLDRAYRADGFPTPVPSTEQRDTRPE